MQDEVRWIVTMIFHSASISCGALGSFILIDGGLILSCHFTALLDYRQGTYTRPRSSHRLFTLRSPGDTMTTSSFNMSERETELGYPLPNRNHDRQISFSLPSLSQITLPQPNNHSLPAKLDGLRLSKAKSLSPQSAEIRIDDNRWVTFPLSKCWCQPRCTQGHSTIRSYISKTTSSDIQW